jgi:hypothetical protein
MAPRSWPRVWSQAPLPEPTSAGSASSPSAASARSVLAFSGADTANEACAPRAASARARPGTAAFGARTTSPISGLAVVTWLIGRSSSRPAASE